MPSYSHSKEKEVKSVAYMLEKKFSRESGSRRGNRRRETEKNEDERVILGHVASYVFSEKDQG